MKAAALSFMLSLTLLAAHKTAWARDAVLPAGTLLQCTLDEPNFSSATASVGDPVLCYPHGLQVFGQIIFPRGTYIVGHLADDKEPGHFWGKGNLHLEFDRIGLPSADVPLAAKIIAVSGGYRVDKEGKIVGKGHAKRDTVEWLFPPLWPWKIITLPMRGPRPALKGETRLTLRLMDDVLVPDAASYRRFGRLDTGETYAHPALYIRPQPKLGMPSSLTQPVYRSVSWQPQAATTGTPSAAPVTDNSGWRKFGRGVPTTTAAPVISTAANAAADDVPPASAPAGGDKTVASGKTMAAPETAALADDSSVNVPDRPIVTLPAGTSVTASAPAATIPVATTGDASGLAKTLPAENTAPTATPVAQTQKPKLTLFALQMGTIYAVTDYWRDEDRLDYVLVNGKEGQLDLTQLDWKTTSQLNAERNVKVTLRDGR